MNHSMQTRHIKHVNRPPALGSADLESTKREIFAALITQVQRVQRHTPDSDARPNGSVYVGMTGIVVMCNQLAALPLPIPHNSLSPPNLLSLADSHLTTALCIAPTALSIPRSPSHASFLETAVGIATLILLRAIQGSPDRSTITSPTPFADSWPAYAQIVQSATQMAVSEDQVHRRVMDDDGCEVLYGRAGLLYSLLLLRRAVRSRSANNHSVSLINALQATITDSNIQSLVHSIIARGKFGSAAYATGVIPRELLSVPDLMWTWHGKRYLGAAHGVAGILQIILMCPKHIVAPHMPEILNTVEWLLECQDSSGNWPSKGPSPPLATPHDGVPDRNELVQWCHGAPGVLIMLTTLIQRSIIQPEIISLSQELRTKILSSLSRGASLVYKHGLLRKGVGLCHGVAGSIYALLAVSNILDNSQEMQKGSSIRGQHRHHHKSHSEQAQAESKSYYLVRAVHLAHLATTHETLTAQREMSMPDHPWSLYEGMAGMCCAWGEILCRLDSVPQSGTNSRRRNRSGMPGFDDIEINGEW